MRSEATPAPVAARAGFGRGTCCGSNRRQPNCWKSPPSRKRPFQTKLTIPAPPSTLTVSLPALQSGSGSLTAVEPPQPSDR